MQLGFAIIPLIHFVSDKKTMGKFSINIVVKILAWLVAAVLVALNVNLLYHAAGDFFAASGSLFWKAMIVAGAGFLVFLLGYIVVYPYLVSRKAAKETIQDGQERL
jgi:manganese transport protein